MNFKKAVVLLIGLFLVFGMAGCKKKEGSASDKEVEKMFPRIKETSKYLLENYPIPKEEAIDLFYKYKNPPDEYGNLFKVELGFDESVTKKQMIEAGEHVIEAFIETFSEDEIVGLELMMGVNFTEDGTELRRLWDTKEKIKTLVIRARPEEMEWEIEAVIENGDKRSIEWVYFDPEEIEDGEKPKEFTERRKILYPDYEPEEETKEDTETPKEESKGDNETLKEEPKEEPDNTVKVIPGLKLGEIKEYLESGDVKEFSFIEEGEGYLSTGIDSDGAYGYTAFVDKNKEDVISVMYMITHKQNLTDEEFLELAQLYLSAVGSYPYEGVDTSELTDFIINNVEEVIKTGEAKTKVIGGLTFSIGYLGNSVTLTVLNETE